MPSPRAKTFESLKRLDEKGISYHYTPFDQGAMVDILDPNWQGSCNALVHDWMLRKASQSDMKQPATYRIDEPFLPHPVIVGSNEPNGEDIMAVEDKLSKAAGEQQLTGKSMLNRAESGVDRLVSYIGSAENHYGVIRGQVLCVDNTPVAHVLAFVKRGEQISFFDPNYGEITFNNLNDFRFWLNDEVVNGRLKLIGETPKDTTYHLSDIFPQPLPTEEELNSENPLERDIANRRLEAHMQRSTAEREIRFVLEYEVTSYKSDVYCNPDPAEGYDAAKVVEKASEEPIGPPPNVIIPPFQLDSEHRVIGFDRMADGSHSFIALNPRGDQQHLIVHADGKITDKFNNIPDDPIIHAMAVHLVALFKHFELAPPSSSSVAIENSCKESLISLKESMKELFNKENNSFSNEKTNFKDDENEFIFHN